MRNLHEIRPQFPEAVRLAAIYWENYRNSSANPVSPDDFRFGWSPTHPAFIFWDHYISEELINWGYAVASEYGYEKKRAFPLEEINVNVSLKNMIDIDKLYSSEEIENWFNEVGIELLEDNLIE